MTDEGERRDEIRIISFCCPPPLCCAEASVRARSKVRVGGFQAVDPAFAGKFDLAYRRIERDLRFPL
jgi:hypothetical protein